MPIVISHTPPMELLSRAGYYIGAGELRQQQEEMQQRERMQIRGIEANLLSQQLAQQNQQQRDVWGAQMDQQRLDQQQQHQLELQGNQQQMQQKLAEIRQQDRQDALEMKLKAQNELAAGKFRDQVEWDQAKHLYGEASDVTSLIREQLAEGLDFETEQQRKEYEDRLAQIEKTRKDPTLREIQKAQGVYELATILPIPKKRIPTTEEQLKEQMITVPDPNNPGKVLMFAPDRDGNPRLISGGDSGSAKEDTSVKDLAMVKEKRQKAYFDAYKLLTKKTLDGKDVNPSHEEVVKYLEKVEQYSGGSQPQEAPSGDGVLRFKKDKSGKWVPE